MSSPRDPLAAAAVEHIKSGMIVGLGTGRAASRAIEALGVRAMREKLELQCVATSARSAELARSLDLNVIPMAEVERVDVLFDGVDELDPKLAMTKGGGGAMTREKIVAEAADLRIYLMDQSKKVARLGARNPLPVEALEFGGAAVMANLRRLGLTPRVRRTDGHGGPARTDDGNLILDCDYNGASEGDLAALSLAIDHIPGVVGHGLFVDQADIVFIEPEIGARAGELERLERK